MKEIRSSIDTEALRRRSTQWLGIGGLIPFWSILFVQFVEPTLGEEWVRQVETWIVIYGVSIVSFMGGGRWVFRLNDPDTHPSSLFGGFLAAVIPPLLAWVIAAWPDFIIDREFTPLVRLLLIAMLLLFQLGQDWNHRKAMPAWYAELRIILTVGATTPIIIGAIIAPMF